jgi:hypothetical protein
VAGSFQNLPCSLIPMTFLRYYYHQEIVICFHINLKKIKKINLNIFHIHCWEILGNYQINIGVTLGVTYGLFVLCYDRQVMCTKNNNQYFKFK